MAKKKEKNKNLQEPPEFIFCPSFEQQPPLATTTTTMAQVAVEPKKAFVVVKDTAPEITDSDNKKDDENSSFLTRSKGTPTFSVGGRGPCVGSLLSLDC